MRLLTTDLFEGAYLLSQGMELNDIWTDSTDAKRSVVFEFGGTDIGILKDNYRKGSAQANVLRLKQAITELKDRMFGLLREKRLKGHVARRAHVKGEKRYEHTKNSYSAGKISQCS